MISSKLNTTCLVIFGAKASDFRSSKPPGAGNNFTVFYSVSSELFP